jgi:hypothetical protein
MTKNVAQDIYYKPKSGPPLLVRDPTPRRGLLEFLDMRAMAGRPAKDSYIEMCIDFDKDPNALEKLPWLELFVVCERGSINLYRPECMFTGFTVSDALASIPVENIFEANVDTKMGLLDLHTEQQVYRFRSQQKSEVSRWQHAVMQSATPGMERLDDYDDDYDDEEPSIWKAINQRKTANGGLESALAKPADKLEAAEESLLLELFCSIGGFDKERKDKDFIDDADLMQWAGNRLNSVKDKAKLEQLLDLATPENCTDAVDGAMIHDEDQEGRVTFNVFKKSMCDHNSALRKIVLACLDTFPDVERWQYLEAIVGELSKPEFILMYHMHMTDVVKACRNQLHDERTEDDQITNNKKVAQVWLSGVEGEVSNLLKKYEEYQKKLRGFIPSLRERVHTHAIDEVFDSHMLPGKRWDSCEPRKSWK